MTQKITIDDQNSTATIAATLAATTAAKAADLATTAATTATTLASKTAETTSVISNDITWMKKSLNSIEISLKDMSSSFISNARFIEHEKIDVDLEKRLRVIESNMWKWMGAISVITAIATTGAGILLKLTK